MSAPNAADVALRHTTMYHRGSITRLEAAVGLLIAAKEHEPADLAGQLPPELIETLKDVVTQADNSGIPSIWSPESLSAEELESRRADARDGAARWGRYFEA